METLQHLDLLIYKTFQASLLALFPVYTPLIQKSFCHISKICLLSTSFIKCLHKIRLEVIIIQYAYKNIYVV
jgi:hypothetical protein